MILLGIVFFPLFILFEFDEAKAPFLVAVLSVAAWFVGLKVGASGEPPAPRSRQVQVVCVRRSLPA